MKQRAETRNLADLTIGPVLSWTTKRLMKHQEALLKIPGSRVLFGGKPLEGHSIPECYGAIEPTAVFVPLSEALKPEHWPVVSTEVFAPMQVRRLCSSHLPFFSSFSFIFSLGTQNYKHKSRSLPN